MTELFNVSLVALLLIAARQWCDANGNETANLTEQPPLVDPDCATNNSFYQFWKDHNLTWIVNATGDCKPCLRDSRKFINDTVLMLAYQYEYSFGFPQTFNRTWKFVKNDTIVTRFGETGILYSQMLYKSPDNKCAVVREELWYRLKSRSVVDECQGELWWDKGKLMLFN
ncbi:hypothetical protein MTO96_044461 [Rhipicephalus appendiculatus]